MDKSDRTLLVSACLLGVPCRYDGGGKALAEVEALAAAGWTLVPVCPEVLGGLPAPRTPAERQRDGRVLDREGRDVTGAFQDGARRALEIARAHGCRRAVLKERSPSCGLGLIYDGSFTGRLVPGDGVAARLLADGGVEVLGESQISELIQAR